MNDKRIIGFRYEATGVFGYAFYSNTEKLCSVSSLVVPSPPVMIDGYGRIWESNIMESATYPGVTRYIMDRESKKQVAKIEYKEAGYFVINNMVIAKCEPEKYVFIRTGDTIAEIIRFEGRADWMPDNSYMDYKAYFEVTMNCELDEEWKLLIMAFPMLKDRS